MEESFKKLWKYDNFTSSFLIFKVQKLSINKEKYFVSYNDRHKKQTNIIADRARILIKVYDHLVQHDQYSS